MVARSVPQRDVAPLQQLESRFARRLHGCDPLAVGPAIGIACATSKRVRPALVLASADAVKLKLQVALDLAVAVEIVHTFSLVHDDIEDDATVRRGLPAVHVADGIPVALNTGDALHVLAWTSLLALDAPAARTLELARRFGVTLERMVAGQARDLLWTRDSRTDITLDDYLNMVRGKTGALLGFAAAAPAVLAGHAGVGALARFGEELGIAFQILDDVASLRACSSTLGKPAGPAANGVGSAPALLRGAGDDGTEAAIELARSYRDSARAALDTSPLAHDASLFTLTEAIVEQLLARHRRINIT